MTFNFTQTPERIEYDLQIAEAMAEEIPRYLQYDGLFYPLSQADYPRLTLGNYLLRQHRLVALADQLDEEIVVRINNITTQFQTSIHDHVISVEQHANQELQTRVNQWDTYLTELSDSPEEYEAYYSTHATDRTILEVIFEFMKPPYRPDLRAKKELELLDYVLHGKWDDGTFIWPEIWQYAYPSDQYWWLYGCPTL